MNARSPDQAPLDVLVIGAGQASLAMGHQLSPLARRFQTVDAGHEVGPCVAVTLGLAATVSPRVATTACQDCPSRQSRTTHTVQQSRGVTPFQGRYTLGLSWLHTRGSALLGWVADDAAFLARQIESAAP